MSLVRSLRLGLIVPSLCVALCGGCSGDSADEASEGDGPSESEGEGQSPMRAGPEGCYIEANFMCDCELDEAACTEDVGIWTEGCMTCAM